MVSSPKPPRRIVIGNNENGKSVVLSDMENPYQYNRGGGSTIYFNEIWTFDDCPIDLSNSKDGANRPLSHSPPLNGAHFRVIESRKEDNKKIDQQAADKFFESMNRTGLSEKMKSDKHWNMHRTSTVDYGVVTKGSRVHILPEDELTMREGDVIVQLGHFHSWDNSHGTNEMLFVMIGGDNDE
ncbi:MAG: hypothetical protein P8K09_04475 [Hyphomicrobiales bacterium]|nr:hypothetical protein [Hyphomicrobiales bacterium]